MEMDKSVFGASLREQTQKFSFLPVGLRRQFAMYIWSLGEKA